MGQPMDVLIVTTESHRRLAEAYFLPTLPPGSGAEIVEHKLDVVGDGAYESETWQTGVTAKLHWALHYIDTHPADTVFALSDVDIQFFPGFTVDALRGALEASGDDVLFQKESRSGDSREVNTGFYVARATPAVRALLDAAAALCATSAVKNDQTAVNQLLTEGSVEVRWGFLPFEYYARSQGFPPRGPVVLHHANFSGSIPEKSAALHRVRRYVTGGPAAKVGASVDEAVSFARTGKLRLWLRSKLHRG